MDLGDQAGDALYSDALGGTGIKPRARLPLPPSNVDFDKYKQSHKLTKGEEIFKSPVGGFLLDKYLSKSGNNNAKLLVEVEALFMGHITQSKVLDMLKKHSGNGLVNVGKFVSQIEDLDKYDFYKAHKITKQLKRDLVAAASEAYHSEFVKSAEYKRFLNVHWACSQPLSLEHIVQYRQLGRGAFGAVTGCGVTYTGANFAIKIMDRKQIKGKKALKLTVAEQRVLRALGERSTPFCIYLRHAFYDETNFYFVLPLLSGGDLGYHLKKAKRFSSGLSQFYTLEVAKGLMHLHKLAYVYRDIKPENILLAPNGHACISDLGLTAKLKKNKKTDELVLRGRAGTPGYWPPEMLSKGDDGKSKLYGITADYYSLGCMLYEMLSGYLPFTSKNVSRFDAKDVVDVDGNVADFSDSNRDEITLKWKMLFCDKFSDLEKDFIQGLCKRNREERLGREKDEIQNHPYFENWLEHPGWESSGQKLIWHGVFPDTFKAPWKPSKNEINAAHQAEIEARDHEDDFADLELTSKDEPQKFYYSSHKLFQRDIIPVLEMEDRGELDHLVRAKAGGGCCIVQ